MSLADRHASNTWRVPAGVETLRDGGAVLLRPAVPADAERLRRMFYRLSPGTRQRWFFVPAPCSPWWAGYLARLAEVDGRDQWAVVAAVGDEVVGIARYDRLQAGDEAELAILIEDAWQGRGLGRRLLARLIAEAGRRRIGAFTATVLGDNRPALRLLAALFPDRQARFEQGEYRMRARLPGLSGEMAEAGSR